jgi:hypothetical protein
VIGLFSLRTKTSRIRFCGDAVCLRGDARQLQQWLVTTMGNATRDVPVQALTAAPTPGTS